MAELIGPPFGGERRGVGLLLAGGLAALALSVSGAGAQTGLNFSGTWAGAYRTTYDCDPINGRSTVRIRQTGTRVTLDITEVGGAISGPPGEVSCEITGRDDLSLSAAGTVAGKAIRVEGGDFRPGRLTYTEGTLAGTLQDRGGGTHNYVWQVRPKGGGSPTTPGTTPPQTSEKPTAPGKTQGVTVRLAEVPATNHTRACDTARARVQYLNGEIQKVDRNLKFNPAGNDVRVQQLTRRLERLEAELGRAYSAAVLACVKGASAAVPVGNGSATVIREKGGTKPLGAGATLLPGDTIRTKEASLAKLTLPDRSQVIMNGGASVTLGDRVRGRPFLQSLGEIRYELKKSMTGAEVRNDRCRDCTATVRGTAFTFAVRGATSVVSTYEGTVAARSGGRTVLVKKGTQSTLAPGKPPTAPTRFTPPAKPFWTSGGTPGTRGAPTRAPDYSGTYTGKWNDVSRNSGCTLEGSGALTVTIVRSGAGYRATLVLENVPFKRNYVECTQSDFRTHTFTVSGTVDASGTLVTSSFTVRGKSLTGSSKGLELAATKV